MLKPFLQAIVLGLPVEYTLPQTNACKSLPEKMCPLAEDEQVTYVLKMPVLSVYPPVSTVLLNYYETLQKSLINLHASNGNYRISIRYVGIGVNQSHGHYRTSN
jgi:hypothetical protein